MLIYVDDIVVASSLEEAVDTLLHDLGLDFALKDLGELHYFLGIEVKKVHDRIIMSQEKYVNDLLHHVNMQICKTVDTPLSVSDKLSLTDGEKLSGDDSTRYRSIVGALQYFTLTRPGIAFSVNKVCQFLYTPTTVHWTTVKRILRFLRGTISLGLRLSKSSSTVVTVYFLMQIGQDVQMIEDLQVALLYMWDQILYHGMLGSKPRYPGPVQRQSISPWRMV
jgi:histone deacetylase 1/2